MDKLVGVQLGTYRLTQQLGEGGFADVYLGEHIYLKTKVAVKVLHSHLLGKQREQFLEEAQLVASLVHPHIVRILHFDIQNNIPFLVMDYAPNGTLRKDFPNPQLPLSSIVTYVKQASFALQYAHDEKKIVHRDVKPENLLLGKNNEVLLSDFGIAVLTRSLEPKPLGFAGTYHYMAPEQINGFPVRASDQYALGIVVYEWLTGTWPFNGRGSEITAQHLAKLPPSFDKNLNIPVQFEQVIMKALAKDPQQRFSSVQEFATALEQAYQAQQPPVVSKSSSPLSASSQPVLPQVAPTIVQKPAQFLTTKTSSSSLRESEARLVTDTYGKLPSRAVFSRVNIDNKTGYIRVDITSKLENYYQREVDLDNKLSTLYRNPVAQQDVFALSLIRQPLLGIKPEGSDKTYRELMSKKKGAELAQLNDMFLGDVIEALENLYTTNVSLRSNIDDMKRVLQEEILGKRINEIVTRYADEQRLNYKNKYKYIREYVNKFGEEYKRLSEDEFRKLSNDEQKAYNTLAKIADRTQEMRELFGDMAGKSEIPLFALIGAMLMRGRARREINS